MATIAASESTTVTAVAAPPLRPEERDQRVAHRHLDLLEDVHDRRIAAQPGEVDHRPASDQEDEAGAGADDRRPPAPRGEKPDAERPEEELEHAP